MKASKLATIISSFNPDEKKQFQKYIESPFFNTNDTLVCLWNILPIDISEKNDEINSLRIWRKLNMRTEYTDDALRKLLSKLNQLAEDFISYQEYNNKTDKHLYFLKACHKRSLPKHFVSGDRQSEDIIQQNNYYNRFYVDYYKDAYQKKYGEKRTKILSAMDNLDNYYIKNKLKIYNTYFSIRFSQKTDYEAVGFKHFVKYAEKRIENNIEFQFYHYMSSMLNGEKIDGLSKLWQILEEGKKQNITEELERNIYKGIKNQLTLKDNIKDQIEDTTALAHFYETLEQKNYLLKDNEIAVSDYKQAVMVNLRIGKDRIEWAYEFMHRNKKYINSLHRENIYTFCLALYYFTKKQHFDSLGHIKKITDIEEAIDKPSASYLMNHHFLALQNYYELEDFDNLLSGINHFRKMLQTDTILSSKTVKVYSNTISMLNNILKLRQGNQKKGSIFVSKIENAKDIYARKWLLAKLKMKMLRKSEIIQQPAHLLLTKQKTIYKNYQ